MVYLKSRLRAWFVSFCCAVRQIWGWMRLVFHPMPGRCRQIFRRERQIHTTKGRVGWGLGMKFDCKTSSWNRPARNLNLERGED
eukprot:scaffold4757_cov93-Skeletonema_dohrnii-CCMP3373.AAC.4